MNGDLSGAGFSAAIRIVPRPSPRLRRALIGLHLGIMGLGWVALADPWAVLTLGLASALHAAQWLRELGQHQAAGRIVLFDSAGAWWIQQQDGRRRAARLAARRLVLPWLLVLPLHEIESGRGLRLILLTDNCPADDLRRPRVRLWWQREASTL